MIKFLSMMGDLFEFQNTDVMSTKNGVRCRFPETRKDKSKTTVAEDETSKDEEKNVQNRFSKTLECVRSAFQEFLQNRFIGRTETERALSTMRICLMIVFTLAFEVGFFKRVYIPLERKCVREDPTVGGNVMKPIPYPDFNVTAYAWVILDTFFL